ncbi:MAG: hypothetical protein U0414_33090 [Polyangiaceae bacterium]
METSLRPSRPGRSLRSRRRVLGGFVGASSLLFVALGSSQGCGQPPPDCRAARGDFAVRFTATNGNCGNFKTGFVGLQSFYKKTADNGQDYEHIYLTMQSEVVGGVMQASQGYGPDFVDTAHKAYGIGDFTSAVPDENNICKVPTMSASEQNIPEVPGEGGAGGAGSSSSGMGGAPACPEPPPPGPFPGAPATDVKAEFSNVKVYVTAAAPGTQFVADMKYSENIDGQSCEATYQLVGIWPVVDCGKYTEDDCGNVTAEPDDTICHLTADKAQPGSVVINPEYKVTCDPDLLVCVPTEPVAQLK